MEININNPHPTAEDLLEIMRVLRSESGCPWDREQSRETLRGFLIGETAELIDEIDKNNPPGICEETGDVLMNLMMQSLVAEEQHEFVFQDAIKMIFDKMIRRHPHVFGGECVNSSGDVVNLWEKIKQSEPEKAVRTSILDSVPKSLSALSQAEKLQRKAAKCGFDWSNEYQIVDKISEELDEVKEALSLGCQEHIDEEIGDLLFAVANLARFRKSDPEKILKNGNEKFARRFRFVERKMIEAGRKWEESNILELELLWLEAKKNEQSRNNPEHQQV